MEDVQNALDQVNDGEVENESGIGVDPMAADESGDSEAKDIADKDDPYSVKKRLGMQAKRHQREMRAMQEQLAQMQAHITQGRGQNQMPDFQEQPQNSYNSPGQPSGPSGSEEERIQRAVRYALDAKDAEERKAKDAERMAHVQKKYQELHHEFDRASDKYDDFDEVVRGHDAPFTPAIRDALLFIDNPSEVAYKLGKNRSELQRISQLHPLDQAKEVNKLAFALMGGTSGKQPSVPRANPLNPAKPNPANSTSVTDKTPPSSIRARMKAGTWK